MVGLFFTLLFGAVALLALGLQLGGVENALWAKVCYVLAGVLLIAAFTALFWPRLWPLLSQLKNLRLRWPLTFSPTPQLKVSRRELAERHIRYHETPIRLVDLFEAVGVDGAIVDFTIEHCILEGPGIIAFRGPTPASERQTGMTAHLSLIGPELRVEGAPETTLYEIEPGGTKRLQGVIHFIGPTIRNVTFRNLGFAGTPEELEWLKKHLIFGEGFASE